MAVVPVQVRTPSGQSAVFYAPSPLAAYAPDGGNGAGQAIDPSLLLEGGSVGLTNAAGVHALTGDPPDPRGIDEVRHLAVGDLVYRKGDLATVVHVENTLNPPAYIVKMAESGMEVSTERHCLTLVSCQSPLESAYPPVSPQENQNPMSFADVVKHQQHQPVWDEYERSSWGNSSPLSVSPTPPPPATTLEDEVMAQEGIQRYTFADAVHMQQQESPISLADVVQMQRAQSW
eukprot:2258990-Amphidinium_carterae.1